MFERLLIDSDWAINNGNWMWLSCSSFFYQALPPPFVSKVSLVMLPFYDSKTMFIWWWFSVQSHILTCIFWKEV